VPVVLHAARLGITATAELLVSYYDKVLHRVDLTKTYRRVDCGALVAQVGMKKTNAVVTQMHSSLHETDPHISHRCSVALH